MEMKGPVIDHWPPQSGQLHRWKFTNATDEAIFFITVLIGPPEATIPKIRRSSLVLDEKEQLMDLFTETNKFSFRIKELFPWLDSIKPKEAFEIHLVVSEPFSKDSYVQFIPLDSKKATIVSSVEISSTQVEGKPSTTFETNAFDEVRKKFLIEPFINDLLVETEGEE